jgi:hypothetical protein
MSIEKNMTIRKDEMFKNICVDKIIIINRMKKNYLKKVNKRIENQMKCY